MVSLRFRFGFLSVLPVAVWAFQHPSLRPHHQFYHPASSVAVGEEKRGQTNLNVFNSNNNNVDNNGKEDVSPQPSLVSRCATTFGAIATVCLLSFSLNNEMVLHTNGAAWAADDGSSSSSSQTSLLLQDSPKTQLQEQKEASVVDEVWSLVDKYYIDRSFNGQDWIKAHEKYIQMANKSPNDNTKLMKVATDMVSSLGDKYTRMLDVQQYSAIQKFDLIGVGVTLMPDSNKQIIVGAPPIENSPSAQAGLKVGDFVTAVNGISTKGRTAFDIIDQISENPNAKTVTFTLQRQGPNDLVGEGSVRDVTMERQNFMEVKDPIQYKVSEVRSDGTKVGYIRLAEFNSLVKAKLEDALSDLEKQKVNAYVIDLRMNTGGAFQSAVEISSLFVEDRVATYVVDGNQVELPFKTAKGRLAIDKTDPLVLWIDGTSASASEVLAGSLHDNCRAVTMGSKSFGKGLIQAVYGLKNGAGLVLTVAKYVTPSGNEIQGIGITPDIEGNVPPPPVIPVLSTDTSKVDFKDIAKRLDPSMCALPVEHATAISTATDSSSSSAE